MLRITYKEREILSWKLRWIFKRLKPRSFRIDGLIIAIEDDF